MVRWEAVKADTLVVTFDDGKTSAEHIVGLLKEGKLKVQGQPVVLP